MELRDRFLGTILGLAIGDALGAPFEGRSRDFFIKNFTNKKITVNYEKMSGYPIGQYTDDTQMTLKLIESIISKNGVDGADIADKFASLWRSNTIIDGGAACRDAMMKIIVHDADWDDAAVDEGRAGNGTAMRTAPIGLFDHNDLAALIADATTQSTITHKDPRATASAIAVSAAIHYAINNETIEPEPFIDFLITLTDDVSEVLTKRLKELKSIRSLDEEAAFDQIVTCCGESGKHKHGVCGYVVPTVMAALYSFFKTPGDWTASVECALRFGGDTDTVASITSAISGSYNGASALPLQLVEDLKDREYIAGITLKLYEITCNRSK